MRVAKLFNVYDSKAEAYGPAPMVYETTGLAIRAFEKACNQAGTGFYENPGDYTLFEVGTYDVQSGHIELYEAKKALGTALEFKKAEKVQ